MDLILISACMRMEVMHKSGEQRNKRHTHTHTHTHTHKTQDMISWKPFREKTKLEGEATLLSFFALKYAYRYKEVMPMARGVLRFTNLLYVLYLLSHMDIFSQLWNKILSKEWNASCS